MANPSNTSFVCCVESGPLETQTVRMVESMRRWGGMFAQSPIFAVTPRFGPPLARKTHAAFEKFGVQYIRHQPKTNYSWFHFLNKPLALTIAEEYITSEAVCWLDSDLLIVDEPEKLFLVEGEDFLGCASDKEMGTSGPGDAFEPLWQKCCQVLGMNIEDLPWITTEMERERIRIYWNGGIFVYRRSTGFAEEYLKTCTQLLDARNIIDHPGFALGFNEMCSIGLAMTTLGISWRALPFSHDYIMSSLSHNQWYREEQLQEAKIIHYHDSMWHWFWPTLIECLERTHPETAKWLVGLGPMKNEAAFQNRILIKLLKYTRKKQEEAYLKICQDV